MASAPLFGSKVIEALIDLYKVHETYSTLSIKKLSELELKMAGLSDEAVESVCRAVVPPENLAELGGKPTREKRIHLMYRTARIRPIPSSRHRSKTAPSRSSSGTAGWASSMRRAFSRKCRGCGTSASSASR